MRFSLVTIAIFSANAQDTESTTSKPVALAFDDVVDTEQAVSGIHATDLANQRAPLKSDDAREILPVREYVSQQFLRAIQGRGMDDWVLALERALASTVATTQNTLWRNELVENISRQREQIRRRVDNVPAEQVPSILSAMPKRTKNAWNGRLDEVTGERLPSFADVIADTWVESVGDTLNLPLMGPFNPALWKPEEVAEVMGPLFNMIPHETAKLIQHKASTDSDNSESFGLSRSASAAGGWSEFLNFLSGNEFDNQVNPLSIEKAHDETQKLDTIEAEIPGFGHLVMNDEWQTYKVNPAILDLPILGALNPSQQLAANLPPVYLPYKAQRLREHAPEWLHLDGLNALMPVNAYTPKTDGTSRDRRPLPLYSILRGAAKTTSRRRLDEMTTPRTWTQTITESKLFRSILHYLPRYGKSEIETSNVNEKSSDRALASVNGHSGSGESLGSTIPEDVMLEGKRYYHTSIVDTADHLPPSVEKAPFDI